MNDKPSEGQPEADTGIMNWLADPADARVQVALGWTCDICQARRNHLCTNPIHPDKPLPRRVVHYGRLTDRRT